MAQRIGRQGDIASGVGVAGGRRTGREHRQCGAQNRAQDRARNEPHHRILHN
ncbi:MAG: hypothetical protein V3R74_08770 [Alphaproteobacteria bacterium]